MNGRRGRVKGGALYCGGNRLDLARKLPAAADYEDREIVFGFRPEAVVLGRKDGAYVIECGVELTEMLGDNTNVYVSADGDQAILKVDSHDTPETDKPITFSIPLESVYLFDGETEKVIRG